MINILTKLLKMAFLTTTVQFILLWLTLSGCCLCKTYSEKQYYQDGQLQDGGKIWALLVAGSNGYYNYRHQADVCHAYQILRKNGIPEENIIVMMYDDVARSSENPTPNVILNHPDGPNVYKGVRIDYSGHTVNSTNFLAALKGDKETVKNVGTGRVIKSGPKDHIFVNFVDHGAPGFLCFPNDELHARELESALKEMYEKKIFDKMVLYVEACESGSMFETILPDNMNTFVMTAADPRESSYACYFDQLRGTYLGDVFSVKWMEDSDNENLMKESIHHQFSVVRSETNTSHVEEYGDLDIGSLPVASFQGYSKAYRNAKNIPSIQDAVPSHHVPLGVLKHKLALAGDEETKEKLKFEIHRLLKMRRHLEKTVADIATYVAHQDDKRKEMLLKPRRKLTASILDCYEQIVRYFNKKCFRISQNSYALTQMYTFINMCYEGWVSQKSVFEAMDHSCVKTLRLTGIL